MISEIIRHIKVKNTENIINNALKDEGIEFKFSYYSFDSCKYRITNKSKYIFDMEVGKTSYHDFLSDYRIISSYSRGTGMGSKYNNEFRNILNHVLTKISDETRIHRKIEDELYKKLYQKKDDESQSSEFFDENKKNHIISLHKNLDRERFTDLSYDIELKLNLFENYTNKLNIISELMIQQIKVMTYVIESIDRILDNNKEIIEKYINNNDDIIQKYNNKKQSLEQYYKEEIDLLEKEKNDSLKDIIETTFNNLVIKI